MTPVVFERRARSGHLPPALASVAVVAGVAGVATLVSGDGETWWLGAFQLALAAIFAFLSWTMARLARHTYRVRFHDAGVTVEIDGDPLEVPWTAVASWDLAKHRLRGKRLAVPGLCAVPAPGVDPTAGGLDRLWSPRDGCWVLCEPHVVGRPAAELTAAATRFAPDRHKPMQ
jgi:hypothetical protein